MAFEVHEPQEFSIPEAIPEGECSLDSRGTLTAHAEDLAAVGINDRVVCMVDRELLRVALRAPRDDESARSFAVQTVTAKSGTPTGRKRLSISSAIKKLGLDTADVKGRREWLQHDKGVQGFLYLNLMEPTGKE